MSTSSDGRKARGAASRVAILRAGIDTVAGSGMAALTHREVAGRAGVSHALVTYHFANADALRRAVLTEAGEIVTGHLERLLADLPGPRDVPAAAAVLAARLVGDLRSELLTCYEMMLAAVRDPDLRPVGQAVVQRLAGLIGPFADTEQRALDASAALLGHLLVALALGQDDDSRGLRTGVVRLVDYFDPLRAG